LNPDWNMPRPGEACAACGHGFDVGETFRACLYDASEGFVRRDFCAHCDPPEHLVPLGTWRTQRAEPDSRRPPFDRTTVVQVFEQLSEATSADHIRFRFVLALLLWRKKILKLESSRATDAGEVWEFSQVKSDNRHSVPRPELDEDELERLSGQLEGLLGGDTSALEIVPPDLDQETTE
jgi:hypothetical protein